MSGGLADRLLDRTYELVTIPSVSGDETAAFDMLRGLVPAGWRVVDDGDAHLVCMPPPRPGSPLVLFAGHVDTVPSAPGALPARGDAEVLGRGAADMKGGLAVMFELADAIARDDLGTDLDVCLVVVGREELPIDASALIPLLARREDLRGAALAVVLEPTGNALEVGCLGNLNATVRIGGRAAHSARPWLGDNAIHRAIEALGSIADLPAREVEVDGLVFREVISITTIAGGVAANVVPDLVTATVNFRYAPNRTPEEAEERLGELLGYPGVELEVLGNAPPGPVALRNPLVGRLRSAGHLDVGPKQAWTPVAEFAMHGVDAVNLGPGDPRYAHADDERVDGAALVRTYEVLRAFLEGRDAEEADA